MITFKITITGNFVILLILFYFILANVLEIPSGSSDSCSSVESEPIKTPVESEKLIGQVILIQPIQTPLSKPGKPIGEVTPAKSNQTPLSKPVKPIGQVTPAKSNQTPLSKPGKLIGLESAVVPLKSADKNSSLSKSSELFWPIRF